MVLLSAQAKDVPEIARVTFTSEDRARDELHNFNLDGFDSLYPRYAGGRPPVFASHEGLRVLLREEGASFQRLKINA